MLEFSKKNILKNKDYYLKLLDLHCSSILEARDKKVWGRRLEAFRKTLNGANPFALMQKYDVSRQTIYMWCEIVARTLSAKDRKGK